MWVSHFHHRAPHGGHWGPERYRHQGSYPGRSRVRGRGPCLPGTSPEPLLQAQLQGAASALQRDLGGQVKGCSEGPPLLAALETSALKTQVATLKEELKQQQESTQAAGKKPIMCPRHVLPLLSPEPTGHRIREPLEGRQ